MLKACAFILLLSAVNAGLLGSKKCTWGPSYWCENFEQAHECAATEHCYRNVWNQTTKPSVLDDSEICSFCKDIVTDVKNFLENNQTQATILGYMNKACNLLPDDFSQQECKKVEQHYMDQFEQLIQDKVDPNTICSLIKLCGGSNFQSKPQPSPHRLIQAPVLKPAQLTRVSLESGVLRLQSQGEPLCDACNAFVSLAKKEIQNAGVQAAIKAKLDDMCKKLKSLTELECEAAVSAALPQVFKIAAEELTSQICVSAGLCTSSVMTAAQAAAATREHLMAALHSDAVRDVMLKSASRVNADACDTCEEILGYAKIFLNNNATEQEVQQFLTSEVCSQLGEFSDMCKTLVEEYVPQLYSDLIHRLDPASFCQAIGLCKKTTAPVVATPTPPTVSSSVKKPVKVESSLQCILCEFVMSKLDSLLGKNATEKEIIDAVDKVCSLLPSSISTECNDLVNKYGPAIVHLLVHDAQPGVVCSFIGLCASEIRVKMPLPTGQQLCSLCETTMSYFLSILKQNATETEVVHTLEKVCNFLSGEMASQCNTMIQMYGPAIINLLADSIKPDAVCSTVGLCQAGKTMKADGLVHLYRSRGGNH